jgi:dolichol kinase
MKKLACFLYILGMIYYLEFAPDTYFWHGFNILSMLLLSAVCCALVASRKRITENERLLFYYMVGINVARSIYSIVCIHANVIGKTEWKPYATHVFVTLVVITLFLFLIYLAKHKE